MRESERPAAGSSGSKTAGIKGVHNEDDWHVTVRTCLRANYLHQDTRAGSPGEYEKLGRTFVPGFLKFISDWISEHVVRTSD